jgi:lipopolysaccharide transport system permease protein
MAIQSASKDLRLATLDVVRGLAAWETWGLLGVSDIRQRYKRSRLGQFWITLSTAAFVAGVGAVYAFLFNVPVHDYLPFLAVNLIVWAFISGVVSDATAVFVQAAIYLRQDAMPKSIFVMRVLVRNLVAFGHNILIVPTVFLLFDKQPTSIMALAIPGLALLLIVCFPLTLLLGLLSARFRDLPQAVQSILQLAFFVTPVMWRADQIDPAAHYVVDLNPFAIFLGLVSEPLHGRIPPFEMYANAILIIVFLSAAASLAFARYRSRIVYWL